MNYASLELYSLLESIHLEKIKFTTYTKLLSILNRMASMVSVAPPLSSHCQFGPPKLIPLLPLVGVILMLFGVIL